MRDFTLVHVSDVVLLRDLAALVAQDSVTTASLLAHMAEVDIRRLYVPAGYPSMFAYCVEELHLSEDAVYRRIQAARAGRRFPALLAALAEGRLHLTAACLLAPHLTLENAEELIDAATHRRKSEVEALLARRLPQAEMSPRVPAVPTIRPIAQLAPAQVGRGLDNNLLAPAQVESVSNDTQLAPAQVAELRASAVPPSSERFLVQLTIAKSTHEKLRHAQALLSHSVPTGDVAQVLDRALDALIAQLEKRKIGAVSRPRSRWENTLRRRSTARGRYVPAHVRRAVWERDQGQCTFVSATGHRCGARRFLEFDHAEPVARGGKATVEGMRLRCRAHNQYEAERTFGAEFTSRKREEARLAAEARVDAEARARAAAKRQTQDLVVGLRGLGCRADEARRAAEFSETLRGATLEERMRGALKFLSRRSVRGYTEPATAFSEPGSCGGAR